jgi:hypothetical protein
VIIFFEDASFDKNVQLAMKEAKKVRRALREEEEKQGPTNLVGLTLCRLLPVCPQLRTYRRLHKVTSCATSRHRCATHGHSRCTKRCDLPSLERVLVALHSADFGITHSSLIFANAFSGPTFASTL